VQAVVAGTSISKSPLAQAVATGTQPAGQSVPDHRKQVPALAHPVRTTGQEAFRAERCSCRRPWLSEEHLQQLFAQLGGVPASSRRANVGIRPPG